MAVAHRFLLRSLVATLSVLAATHGRGADLVMQPVEPAQRTALPQQRVAWAQAATDLGEAPEDLSLSHLTVVLKRSAQRQLGFERFLNQQQDPRSPNFHHWLTPVEVGEQFGASAHDIAAVTDWLQAQGLHVDAVANSRTRIDFSGSAARVGAAFASRLHLYLVNGEQRIAPAGVPQIPAALSTLVQSVRGLVTIHETSAHGAGAARAIDPAALAPNPGGTFCSPDAPCHYIWPADFAVIYDVDPVYAQGIDGGGQTIAIIGRARVYLPDIENFQMLSGLPIKHPVIIVPPDGVDPGPALAAGGMPSEDQLEATIDVTRATSVAPGATIDLVISGNTAAQNGLAIASQYVVDTNPVRAQIMSVSFGACEADAGQSGVDFYDSVFSQAAAEGISVFVISGDSGAAGCDAYLAAPPASQIASPNYICVSSYATCVGGTEFADTVNPSGYWSDTNSNVFGSALGYIPEGAWNEPLDSQGNPQAFATGGGVSTFIATPSWQTGPGVPGTLGRYTPDISFSASSRDAYFACLAAAGNTCVADPTGAFQFEFIFGTSASTPDMAGIAALLNQKMGSAQGNLNPRLYALAATLGNGVFHDVTVGTSGVSGCDLSVPSMCNNTTPGPSDLSGGLQGYLVGPGYDQATGLGSIDVANLLAQWSSGVNLDQHGLTGSWYNPATTGQGLEIEVYPELNGLGQGLLFAGWFTYDAAAAGGRRWYALSGNVNNQDATATLQIFAEEGGNLNAPPSVDAADAIGQATIHFTDCDTGALTYNFSDGSGRSGSIPLTRLTPNVTCSPDGDNGNAATDYLLSGNWYNPSTSGQGFIFDISPGISSLFAAWYTFAANGQQLGGPASQDWFTLQSRQFADGSTALADIPIFATSGGVFNSPTLTRSSQVGMASIAFQNCNAMTLTYSFTGGSNQGKSGTINIVRVGPAPAGCEL
jgi:pseudomonalisin